MSKITIIRGDSRTITVNYVNASGAVLDLTGATVLFTVNSSNAPTDDSSAVIQKTATLGTPTLGIATISLTNTDTQSVVPGIYYYDVQVKDASGNVTTSKVDKFVVTGDVTRRLS